MNKRVLPTLIRLLDFFPQKWMLILGFIFVFFIAIAEILYSHMIRRMTDIALLHQTELLPRVLSLTVALIIANLTLVFLRGRFLGKFAAQGMKVLRNRAVDHVAHLPISVLADRHSGDYVTRLTNDIGQIGPFISQTLVDLVFGPLTACGAFIYLCFVNWKLTLAATIILPILLSSVSLLNQPIQRYSRSLQERLGEMNTVAIDSITGIELIKAFLLHHRVEKKFNNYVEQSVKIARSLAKRIAILNGIAEIISFSPFFLCFGIGGYWAIRGEMTPGSLIAFLNLLNHLTFPMSLLPGLLGQVQSDVAVIDRVFEILDMEPERSGGVSPSLEEAKMVIASHNLCFTYPNTQEPVLKNLTLQIQHGETVALVGPSGSGKSTFLKLIMGYYQDFAGKLELYGMDLREWDLTELRKQIAWVTQDIYLFPDSIYENIRYGRLDATRDQIVEAANIAHIHEFICQLPQGYDTKIGELGGKLSGGQKQRISIARALVKNAPLILLDEATSALDTESESWIQEALAGLMIGRTSLVIAHRLSTIRNADRILVMDHGTMIESGTHQELMACGTVYNQLYSRQFSQTEQLEEEVI